MTFSSSCDLAGDLLDLDDYELGGFQWREANHNVDDALIDIVLRGGLLVAFNEIGLLWGLPLERPWRNSRA
jgi:hypothetical protein